MVDNADVEPRAVEAVAADEEDMRGHLMQEVMLAATANGR